MSAAGEWQSPDAGRVEYDAANRPVLAQGVGRHRLLDAAVEVMVEAGNLVPIAKITA